MRPALFAAAVNITDQAGGFTIVVVQTSGLASLRLRKESIRIPKEALI
jgi:hypothetical protein